MSQTTVSPELQAAFSAFFLAGRIAGRCEGLDLAKCIVDAIGGPAELDDSYKQGYDAALEAVFAQLDAKFKELSK
jgi:hypothetical protein